MATYRVVLGHLTDPAQVRTGSTLEVPAGMRRSLADGIVSPYRAASMITYVGYHEPAEEPDLLAAMQELRERFEDFPDSRPAVAVEITAVLSAWLASLR